MTASLHASPDVLAVVSATPGAILLLSPELEIVAASEACREVFGLGRSDLIGRDLRAALAGSTSLDAMAACVCAAFDTDRQHRTGPGAAGDGPQLEVVCTPVPAEGGRTRWVLVQAGDGGARSELQAAEARLSSILRTVPDAMIIIDERGRIETLSTTAERLFGYTAQEAVGRNIKLLMPNPHRDRHDGYLARYRETGERRIIGIGRIVVGQRKDGTTFPMHLTIGEMRSGPRHYFTGFIRDLTDQQLTERRLRELQDEVTHMSRFTALGEMASTLAHEINQPLTAINNYLRGCGRLLGRIEGEPVPALREALAKAGDQALRAGQIIRRLREFVARGDSERRIETLSKLVEDASTLALVGTREAAIAVSFRLDPAADQVLVDRIQIQQVLVNLIRNAVEVLMEAPGPRELEVETLRLDDATVQVGVADSGAGLAPEVRDHLFHPFVTTKQKGMGLGLSICRTIVEAHGGRIWAEPRPDGGTVFRFTLRVPTWAPGEEPAEADHGR